LSSTDPFQSPIIDPAYYSNSSDLYSMSGAFRELFRIVNSSDKFSKILDFRTSCEHCMVNTTNNCENFFQCLAKETIRPSRHYAGSCRMGSSTDPKAVVDERLKVRGFPNLRVIDASIMPQNVEPGTYGPSVMVGEKGAQMVIDDHKNI
jgi:choline dehydrogenase